MRIAAIALSIGLGLTAGAAAQGTSKNVSNDRSPPSGAPATKSQMDEIRKLVHELERSTSKLNVLMEDYRNLLDKRPKSRGGGSPEAKAAHDKELERWQAALDRVVRSIHKTHAAIGETTKRLDTATTAKLPTSLGKEVANARNAAGPLSAAAEQVLAKHKPKPRKAAKRGTKPRAPDSDAHLLDDLSLDL